MSDSENRFIGFKSYPDNGLYHELFFGRDKEIKSILRSVYNGGACIIYGKSGIGKTSLINSGLKPSIRNNKSMWPIRISLLEFVSRYNKSGNLNQITIESMIIKAIENDYNKKKISLNKSKELLKREESNGNIHIAEWLNDVTVSNNDNKGQTLALAIIFDQFESLFQLGDKQQIKVQNKILEIINPRLNNDLYDDKFDYDPIKEPSIIIAVTEPELGKLNHLTNTSAALRNNQYRVQGLNKKAAETIIKKISTFENVLFDKPPFDIDDDLLNRILKNSIDKHTGKYSPFFLQLYGFWIEGTVDVMDNNKHVKIKTSNFPNKKFETYLSTYYKDSIKEIGEEKEHYKSNKKIAKKICEEILLSKQGDSLVVDKSSFDKSELRVIEVLKQKRIIVESKLAENDTIVIRISHSKLIQAINENLNQDIEANLEKKKSLNQDIKVKIKKVKKINFYAALFLIFIIIIFGFTYVKYKDLKRKENTLNAEIEKKSIRNTNLEIKYIDLDEKNTEQQKINKDNIRLIKNSNSANANLSLQIVQQNENAIDKIKSEKIPLALEYLEFSNETLNEKVIPEQNNLIEIVNKRINAGAGKIKEFKDKLSDEDIDNINFTGIDITYLKNLTDLSLAFFGLISSHPVEISTNTQQFSDKYLNSQKNITIFDDLLQFNDDTSKVKEFISLIKNNTEILCDFTTENECQESIEKSLTQGLDNWLLSYNRNYFVLLDKYNRTIFWGNIVNNGKTGGLKQVLNYSPLTKIANSISVISLDQNKSDEQKEQFTLTIGTYSGSLINLKINTISKDYELDNWVDLGSAINAIKYAKFQQSKIILVSKGKEVQIRDPDSLMLLGTLISDRVTNGINIEGEHIILSNIKTQQLSAFKFPLSIPQILELNCDGKTGGKGIGWVNSLAISPNLQQILIGGKSSSDIEKIQITYDDEDIIAINNTCIKLNQYARSTKPGETYKKGYEWDYDILNSNVDIENIAYILDSDHKNLSYTVAGRVNSDNKRIPEWPFYKINNIKQTRDRFNTLCEKNLAIQNAKKKTNRIINSINYNGKSLIMTSAESSLIIVDDSTASTEQSISCEGYKSHKKHHNEYFNNNDEVRFVSSATIFDEIYIALNDSINSNSCIWKININAINMIKDRLVKKGLSCNDTDDMFYINENSSFKFIDINKETNRLVAVTSNDKLIFISLDTYKSSDESNEKSLLSELLPSSIIKVHFLRSFNNNGVNIELLASIDTTGQVVIWGILKDEIIRVFALQIPIQLFEYTKKADKSPFSDLDIKCYGIRCMLAVPLINSKTQDRSGQKVYIWNFELPKIDKNTMLPSVEKL